MSAGLFAVNNIFKLWVMETLSIACQAKPCPLGMIQQTSHNYCLPPRMPMFALQTRNSSSRQCVYTFHEMNVVWLAAFTIHRSQIYIFDMTRLLFGGVVLSAPTSARCPEQTSREITDFCSDVALVEGIHSELGLGNYGIILRATTK